MKVVFTGLFAVVMTALFFGILAAWIWLCQHVWNYIAVNTNHPTWQVDFWVMSAIWFLFAVVSGMFRSQNRG